MSKLHREIEDFAQGLEERAEALSHDADRAYRIIAGELRELLAAHPEPSTTMVRIEDHQLDMLREMLHPDRPVTLLRIDQRGDSVAFKVNGGMWSPNFGTPQEAY